MERLVKRFRVSRGDVWLSIMFIASRAGILYQMSSQRRTDLNIYQRYVRQMLEGQIPFKDFFPEYPPLALQFLTLPTIVDPTLEWYFGLYRVVCCLVDCVMWLTLIRAYRDRRVRGSQLLLYMLGTATLGGLIYDRIDIILGAILLFAALALMDCRPTAFHLAVGLGIAVKLIPVIFVPAILAFELRRSGRAPWRALIYLALPTVASFGVLAAIGGYRYDKLFEYHIKRDIEIESIPASIEMVLMDFGMEGAVTRGFGSHNLKTPVDHVLALSATALLGLMTCGTALLAARKNSNARSLAVLFAAILTCGLLLSKVLSPQYFVFLLPVLVVIPECQTKRAATATWILTAVICGLTGFNYSWKFGDLTKLEPTAEALMLLRNECLIVLGCSLLYRAWSYGGDSAADGGRDKGRIDCTTT